MRHDHCIGAGCPTCEKYDADPDLYAAMWARVSGVPAKVRRRADPDKPRSNLGGCGLKAVRVGDRDLLRGQPDPMGDIARDRRPGWAQSACVKDAHVRGFRAMLAAKIPPPGRADGDGIVTCGGGKYWPGLAVALRMTRDVTGLPIQVWHRGGDEPVYPSEVADLAGITFHDATAVTPCPRILEGWEVKTVALLACGLRRAVFIDGDAYFVADPAPLLPLSSAGIAFWSDGADRAKWPWFGVAPEDGRRVPPLQSGQLAVDLVGSRRELVLWHWLCQHSDYFFAHGHGDQDCLRAALAAADSPFVCLGKSEWLAPGFVCKLGGEPLLSHRVDCKFGIDPGREARLPGEARARAYALAR